MFAIEVLQVVEELRLTHVGDGRDAPQSVMAAAGRSDRIQNARCSISFSRLDPSKTTRVM